MLNNYATVISLPIKERVCGYVVNKLSNKVWFITNTCKRAGKGLKMAINCKFDYVTWHHTISYNVAVDKVIFKNNVIIMQRFINDEVLTYDKRHVRNLVITEL